MLLPACSVDSAPGAEEDAGFSPVRKEILRRAENFADDRVLVADFYRIYRKLAYPLPVREIYHPDFHVNDIPRYPWEIWMLWDLEQRVFSLGWAAQWTGNAEYRELVRRDIEALAGWPEYDARETPHLAGAHAARLMAAAYENWDWLGEETRAAIREGLNRLVDSYPEWLGDGRLEMDSEGELLASSGRHLHNIPTIAIIGRSIAARLCNHPLRGKLERHAEALVKAQLKLREIDYTEAVGYDGYILDFVADWLPGASEQFRSEVLADSNLAVMLRQSWITAAPGNLMNVAPLNDVEPREMPFHASAQIKLAAMGYSDPHQRWYLGKLPPSWLRSDALVALDGIRLVGEAAEPEDGAANGLYAMALRSGWEASDLAVVMSVCESSVGHIQKDNGTVLIGTGGRWLIDDPGYQQYVPGLEREFTLGSSAHNYPVIGEEGMQNTNSVKRLALEQPDGISCMAVDITGGYGETAGVSSVQRKVWLAGDSLVAVADIVEFTVEPEVISYHWQINPEAAFWLDGGAVRICLDNESLWVTCAGEALEGDMIRRLPGTRGQITIGKTVAPKQRGNIVWWLFKRGETPAAYALEGDGAEITVGGLTLTAR